MEDDVLASVFMNIVNGLSNPHVRYPLLLAAALKAAEIWFPQYKDKLEGTLEILMMYGIIGASNSGPSSNGRQQNQTDTMKNKLSLFLILALPSIVCLSGCTTALTSDKVIAIKSRMFGIDVETAQGPQSTPAVKLGFISTVWQMIPTSTNGQPVNVPKYMDTFELKQGLNPFETGIGENTGTGDVLVGGGTNDTSKAIVPSPYVPNKQ